MQLEAFKALIAKMTINFDVEADTAIVRFNDSQSVEAELTDDDVIVSFDANEEVVCATILHVSTRAWVPKTASEAAVWSLRHDEDTAAENKARMARR